jgi:hypothetical protein
MVTQTGWRVEVRDPALAVVGVCDTFTALRMTLRHRKAGAWTLALPAAHPQAALFVEGGGIIVWAPWSDTEPILSGPLTRLSATAPSADEAALLTVDGVDDTALLADRLVMPDPSSPLSDQDAVAYYTYSGAAEGAIRTVVHVNAGQGALLARRMCDADPDDRLSTPGVLLGTTRAVHARFDNLLTLVDQLATIDNLRVRLVQPPGVAERHLQVALPNDVSEAVRLSQPAGTLTSATAVLSAPGATRVLVAGGGEETTRVLVERADTGLESDWARRVEAFRDARDTDVTTELEQRGDETLAEAGATAGIAMEPVDTPTQRYGVDYQLGDVVTVEVGEASYTDVVTAVTVAVDAAGGTVTTPSVGDPDAANLTTPAIYQRVRDLTRRLEALERRQ